MSDTEKLIHKMTMTMALHCGYDYWSAAAYIHKALYPELNINLPIPQGSVLHNFIRRVKYLRRYARRGRKHE